MFGATLLFKRGIRSFCECQLNMEKEEAKRISIWSSLAIALVIEDIPGIIENLGEEAVAETINCVIDCHLS